MSLEKVKDTISNEIGNLAFIFGNGINLYGGSNEISWTKLLNRLWLRFTGRSEEIPIGISLTEYYDVIDLKNPANKDNHDIQKEVRDLLKYWEPSLHHKEVLTFIQKADCPLLTTNFDEIFKRALNLEQFRIKNERMGFTDYYPWDTYHSYKNLNSPTEGFGVWYINGMIKYHRSIRLGLTHYMGSVERARKMIHADDEGMFKGKSDNDWIGNNTWLHIVFNKSLIILGLSLSAQETFLRWLLIERARYFKNFAITELNGWYVYNENEEDIERSGKHFFLEQVGIKPIGLSNYDEIYNDLWINYTDADHVINNHYL